MLLQKKYSKNAIHSILNELEKQYKHLINNKQIQEAERLKSRVNYDIEMIKELGYCSGIENYSRYLDGRKGKRTTILSYGLLS